MCAGRLTPRAFRGPRPCTDEPGWPTRAVPTMSRHQGASDGRPAVIRGDAALVHIRVSDFGGDTPSADAIESMSGFTLVLTSLKSWLEHGIEGDLMYDRFPDAEYSDR